MKKKLLAWLTLGIMAVSACGCDLSSLLGGGGNDSQTSSSSSSSVEETVKVEQLLGAQARKTIAAEETVSYTVNKDLNDRNYMILGFSTNVNLYGEFVYSDLADAKKVVKEPFFVKAGDTEFKQFLDAYRPNGVGLFEKRLQEITLKNLEETAGEVILKDVSVSDRQIPEFEREIYLEKNGLKIGADLMFGGTLTFVGRTDFQGQTVDEIIDKEGNIKYGVDAKSEEGAKHLSSEVNLVTIFDPGRQIQQSYYAEVGGTDDQKTGANGYDRGWCYTDSAAGDWWSYNPVQAGDCADNPAQLIDYEVTNGQIYVKARPMDWGKGWQENWANEYEKKAQELGGIEMLGLVKGGVTTKSYAENWYTIKGGLLYVDNKFVDWNGFTDMDKITPRLNETPAFFPVHTLHTFVTYTGISPWGGDTAGLYRHENPESRGNGQQLKPMEDWIAWVNEDDFGMGLYVPNVDRCTYSKITQTASKDAPHNQGAYNAPMVTNPQYLMNKPKPTSNYTACYVRNACYTAPVVMMTMKEYVTVQYQYAIAVDTLTGMREKFYALHEIEAIKNDSFGVWRS